MDNPLTFGDLVGWWRAYALLILPMACGLVYAAGLSIDRWQTARRSRALFAALNDSARGRAVASRLPGRTGFVAVLEPPPEPFVRCGCEHVTAFALNPLAWLFPSTVPRREILHLTAHLPARPTQEVAWARGQTPPAALGTQPDLILWCLHRLDFRACEYATRGDNPNAVRHLFAELQTRFGPFLEQVTVYRDDAWHIRVSVRPTALTMNDVPVLVGLLRALGRAAQV